ncbi:MAG: hypothetical protein JW739_02350 [Opitutales bacterium]|nr:hypothetical protein [Opitutales bacterium]
MKKTTIVAAIIWVASMVVFFIGSKRELNRNLENTGVLQSAYDDARREIGSLKEQLADGKRDIASLKKELSAAEKSLQLVTEELSKSRQQAGGPPPVTVVVHEAPQEPTQKPQPVVLPKKQENAVPKEPARETAVTKTEGNTFLCKLIDSKEGKAFAIDYGARKGAVVGQKIRFLLPNETVHLKITDVRPDFCVAVITSSSNLQTQLAKDSTIRIYVSDE